MSIKNNITAVTSEPIALEPFPPLEPLPFPIPSRDSLVVDTQSTGDEDSIDMKRLGKIQAYKRNFGTWSTFGFVSLYMATWEYVLVSPSSGFANGGFAGLVWTFLFTFLCFSTVVMSLAELESMAPTSGGMYSWISEFGPESCQKWLSYIAGWLSSLGWIASASSGAFISATLVQATFSVIHNPFRLANWLSTLVMLAFLVLAMTFNNWGSKTLPALQTFALFAHMFGWALVLISLLVSNGGHFNSPSSVFTNAEVHSGWKNLGVACLISQVGVIYCNLGSSSSVHISEEVSDASLVVPRCMFWSYISNVFAGIAMLVVMLFCIGPISNVLESEAPFIVLFNRLNTGPLALFLTVTLSILMLFGNITAVATASREVWAFSRDRGFPCSNWISVVDTDKNIPVHAVYLTVVLAGVLCLVNMGGTLAFEIVMSTCLLGILSTYMLSIGCVIYRRLRGDTLPPARWSLGRYGLAVNLFGFFYCGFVIVFACFPTKYPVRIGDANWAPFVWMAVIGISTAVYAVHGRKHYMPPGDLVDSKRPSTSAFASVEMMSTKDLRQKR